jgi:hypothetical protein
MSMSMLALLQNVAASFTVISLQNSLISGVYIAVNNLTSCCIRVEAG